uniref:Uncharacterized protein n=1 Tax=Anopheles atroparvus TaxID=41427 RepID=A0A182J7G7_ANOAO
MEAVSGRLNKSTSIFSTGLMLTGVCFRHDVVGEVVELEVERQDQVNHDIRQHFLHVALRRRLDEIQQKDNELLDAARVRHHVLDELERQHRAEQDVDGRVVEVAHRPERLQQQLADGPARLHLVVEHQVDDALVVVARHLAAANFRIRVGEDAYQLGQVLADVGLVLVQHPGALLGVVLAVGQLGEDDAQPVRVVRLAEQRVGHVERRRQVHRERLERAICAGTSASSSLSTTRNATLDSSWLSRVRLRIASTIWYTSAGSTGATGGSRSSSSSSGSAGASSVHGVCCPLRSGSFTGGTTSTMAQAPSSAPSPPSPALPAGPPVPELGTRGSDGSDAGCGSFSLTVTSSLLVVSSSSGSWSVWFSASLGPPPDANPGGSPGWPRSSTREMAVISSLVVVSVPVVAVLLLVGSASDDTSDSVLLGSCVEWYAPVGVSGSSGCPPFAASSPVLGLSWMNWGGTAATLTAGLDLDFFAVVTGCCCCCWLDGTKPMLPFMLTTCHQFRWRALVWCRMKYSPSSKLIVFG